MVIFYSYVSLPEGTPLKNMSQMEVLFPIYGKMYKNVPNHQPENLILSPSC